MTDGGEGSYKRIMSEETRKKISKNCNNKGENNPRYGATVTKETRKKISKSNSGKKYSDEVNSKKGLKGNKNYMYGKSVYDVWLEKYGKEIADNKLNEMKLKMKKRKPWNKGIPRSEETKQKISNTKKQKNEN